MTRAESVAKSRRAPEDDVLHARSLMRSRAVVESSASGWALDFMRRWWPTEPRMATTEVISVLDSTIHAPMPSSGDKLFD